MTQTIKQFNEFDDALWFIEQNLAYVEPEDKFRAELLYVNGRWRVTVEQNEDGV